MRQKITGKLPDDLRRIVTETYPDYRGRKYAYNVADHPLDVRSYWDGGSRSYYTFVELATGRTVAMPAQSAYNAPIKGADAVMLPDGIICVEHSYFCGHDMGIIFHVSPANLPRMLAAGAS